MEGTRTTQKGHSANVIVIHSTSQENHTMSLGSDSKEEFSSVQSKEDDHPVNLS
jgi:hypothetical protein